MASHFTKTLEMRDSWAMPPMFCRKMTSNLEFYTQSKFLQGESRIKILRDIQSQRKFTSHEPLLWGSVLPNEGCKPRTAYIWDQEAPTQRNGKGNLGGWQWNVPGGWLCSEQDEHCLERSRTERARKHILVTWCHWFYCGTFTVTLRTLRDYLEKGLQRAKQMLTPWWKNCTQKSRINHSIHMLTFTWSQ